MNPERLKMLGAVAQKGEIAILEKVFALQEALDAAQANLAVAQAQQEVLLKEQERDKKLTVTIDQPPVDVQPVIDAIRALQQALPVPEKPEKIDLTPVVEAVRDLQTTMATEQQFSEPKDYTTLIEKLLVAVDKPTREQEIIDLLSRPAFEIPSYLIKDGRIKVEVDKVGGGGTYGKVYDSRGVAIDPATRQNQESILSALTTNYATKIDVANSTTTYVGEAVIGSATSTAVWRIKKLVCVDSDLTITWADGNDSYDNIWDNRATITFS